MSAAPVYGWRLDLRPDIVDEGCSPTVYGPADLDPEIRAALDAQQGHRFRLLDDDREVYGEGRIIGDVAEERVCFAPLDDYGTPGLGATEIQYRERGRWQSA